MRWVARTLVLLVSTTVLAQQQTPLQRLRASIERTTRSINATWGIYVKSLDTGEEIALDADRQMETMSTIKIPLMAEVFEQIKAGKFKLTDKYTFVQADSQPGTGTIQRLDPGAVMTVKDLITMMIIVSDNTATEVLYRMVGGPAPVNARMDALGLENTRAMNVPSKWFPALRAAPSTEQFYRDGKSPFGLSTAREMGRLLEMIERGTLVDKPSSDLMLQIMRGQLYRTRIPRYVTGYRIPHKTGDFLPFVGDDGDAGGGRAHDHPQHLHRESLRLRRGARERHRPRCERRGGLLRVPPVTEVDRHRGPKRRRSSPGSRCSRALPPTRSFGM